MSNIIYIISCKDCKQCKIFEFNFRLQDITEFNVEDKLSCHELTNLLDEIQKKYHIKIKYSNETNLFDIKDNVLKQSILKALIKEINNRRKKKENVIKELDDLIYKFRPVFK
jgi:hypothetical protein